MTDKELIARKIQTFAERYDSDDFVDGYVAFLFHGDTWGCTLKTGTTHQLLRTIAEFLTKTAEDLEKHGPAAAPTK